jgi:hypothetical protein
VLQHVSRRISIAVQVRVSTALSPKREAPSKTAVLRIGSIQKRIRGKAATTGNSQSAHQAANVINSTTRFERRCRSHVVARSGSSPRRLTCRRNIETKGKSRIATRRIETTRSGFNADTARRSVSAHRSDPQACRDPPLRCPYPPRAETTRRSSRRISPANLDYLVCPCFVG